MDKVYVLIHFRAKNNGEREVLDCNLYATEKEAREQLEQDVHNTLNVFSEGCKPTKEHPIRSVGSRFWHEIDLPPGCNSEQQEWITWEIHELPLPSETKI